MQQFTGPFSIWLLRQGCFLQQIHKCHCSSPGYHQCGMLFKVSPPVALLQWWGTSKSAGQVLAVQQLYSLGRSASLITGHTQLHQLWRRTRCSTPDSFCTTVTEYWAKTVAQLFFSSPFDAVYSFILLQFSTGLGFGFFVAYMLQGLAMLSATIIDWFEQTKPADLV